MSYYGYHQSIKQRIQNGELLDCYVTNNCPRIGSALVLVFNTVAFLRPIRPHRWAEYKELLRGKGLCPECA